MPHVVCKSRMLLAAVLVVFALALSAALPAPAWAKSYEMPQVDITASITDTANVDIVEHRQFSFDGSFTCVWWTFTRLPSNASIQVHGVSLQQGAASSVASTQAHEIPEVDFQTPWRSAGGPGTEAYSWDRAQNTLYVFFAAANEDLIVTIDYTVENGMAVYDDFGELYWQYVTAGWEIDSQNVTATVELPVPTGGQVRAGENVYAWGHGPLDGRLDIDAENQQVLYQVPRVQGGQYSEARVLVPTDWLPNASESSRALHAGQECLQDILADEQSWADSANAQRVQSLLFVAFWLIVCIGLLIWAIVMFFRWGKELKPQFDDDYWRDVPDKELSPAVVGRLMNWNATDSAHFTATLMNLSTKGVIRIDKGTYEDRRGTPVEDYYLTLLPDMLDQVPIDTLERKAIEFVFGEIAKGKNALWFKSIELYGKKHPRSFANQMEKWQGQLTAEVNKAQLFEAKGDELHGNMLLMAGGLLVIAVMAAMLFDNLLPLAPVIPTSIVLAAISRFMQRRTQRGADVAAKSKAMKKWMRDFTQLDESAPTDLKVWGFFMVYAFMFGIADEVLRNLRMGVPAFRNMDDATFYSGMPYYYWYAPGPHRHMAAATLFDNTIANTMSTAQAAISGSSGGFSSGGGFGGGFSVGGGGGFGGGGGAR